MNIKIDVVSEEGVDEKELTNIICNYLNEREHRISENGKCRTSYTPRIIGKYPKKIE